jgi:hypothetical protein
MASRFRPLTTLDFSSLLLLQFYFRCPLFFNIDMTEGTMRWKQFFTRVASLEADDAKQLVADKPAGDVTVLDVRQPSEYEKSHIPGAKLIPLPELNDRIGEIDPGKPTVVY